MKFVCYRDDILKAISSVSRGVASKTTMPVLEGILIQTNDKEIKLTSYDLEIGIEVVAQCDVIEQGSTVVNAFMFGEIVRKLPNSEIKFSLDDRDLLEIECEGALYKLATMNPDEFPELPKIEVENSIVLDQIVLKDMIKRTIFAVSSDDSKPIFKGSLFEVADGVLSIVSIDGFRLALRKHALAEKVPDFSAVIPGKTLMELNKILEDSYEEVRLGVSKNQALFQLGRCKVVTRIIDGEFLNYRNVIPDGWETRFKVDRSALQDCFERISLISSSSVEREKKYPVRVNVGVGNVVISCANQTGDAKEELFVDTEGQSLEVGFNPKYFLDSLKAIDDDEVFVQLGSSISPCIVKAIDGDSYVYMILPIRLKEE